MWLSASDKDAARLKSAKQLVPDLSEQQQKEVSRLYNERLKKQGSLSMFGTRKSRLEQIMKQVLKKRETPTSTLTSGGKSSTGSNSSSAASDVSLDRIAQEFMEFLETRGNDDNFKNWTTDHLSAILKAKPFLINNYFEILLSTNHYFSAPFLQKLLLANRTPEVILCILFNLYHHPIMARHKSFIINEFRHVITSIFNLPHNEFKIIHFLMLIYLIGLDIKARPNTLEISIRDIFAQTSLFSFFNRIGSIYTSTEYSSWIQLSKSVKQPKKIQDLYPQIMGEQKDTQFAATKYLYEEIYKQLVLYSTTQRQPLSSHEAQQFILQSMKYEQEYPTYTILRCMKLQQTLKNQVLEQRQLHTIISELERISCDRKRELLIDAYSKMFRKLIKQNNLYVAESYLKYLHDVDGSTYIKDLLKAYKDKKNYNDYFRLLLSIKNKQLKYTFDINTELEEFLSIHPDLLSIITSMSESTFAYYFDLEYMKKIFKEHVPKIFDKFGYMDMLTWLSANADDGKEYLMDSLMRKIQTDKYITDYDVQIILEICEKLPPSEKKTQVYLSLFGRCLKDGNVKCALHIIQLLPNGLERNQYFTKFIDYLFRQRKYRQLETISKQDFDPLQDVIRDKIQQLIRTNKFRDASTLLQVAIKRFPPQRTLQLKLESRLHQIEQKILTTPPKIPILQITTDDLAYVASQWSRQSSFSALTQAKVKTNFQKVTRDGRDITLLDVLELWYKPRDRYYLFHSSNATSVETLIEQLTRPPGESRDLRGRGFLGDGFYLTPDLYQSFYFGLIPSHGENSGSIYVLSISKEDAKKFKNKSDFSFGDRDSYIKESDRLEPSQLPTSLGLKEIALKTDTHDPSDPSRSILTNNHPLLSLIQLDMVLLLFHRHPNPNRQQHSLYYEYTINRSPGTRTVFNIPPYLKPLLNLLFSRGQSSKVLGSKQQQQKVLGGGIGQSKTVIKASKKQVSASQSLRSMRRMIPDFYLKNRQFDRILFQGNSTETYKKYISQVLKYSGGAMMDRINRVIKEGKGEKMDETPILMRVDKTTTKTITIAQELATATRSSMYLVYFQELVQFLDYMKTEGFSTYIKNIIELFPPETNVRILFNHFIPPLYGKTMVRCLIYNAGPRELKSDTHRQVYFTEFKRRTKTTPLALLSTSDVTPQPILVIPPYSREKDYVDINTFVRQASIDEMIAFFSFSSNVISFAMSNLSIPLQNNRPLDTESIKTYCRENNLARKGVFVSFHSGTVGWLHLRIEATPAYYNQIPNWEEYLENPLYRKVLQEIKKSPSKLVTVKIFTLIYQDESNFICSLNQTLTVPEKIPMKSILYDYFNIPITEDEQQAQQLINILHSTMIIFFNPSISDVSPIRLPISSNKDRAISLVSILGEEKTVKEFVHADGIPGAIGLVII